MITRTTAFEPVKNIRFGTTGFCEAGVVESSLRSTISDGEGPIGDMCSHILNAGGKRVRPLLVIYAGKLFSAGASDELIQAAVAAELIHMASLVHDDVIDRSDFRRGRPSVNSVWDNSYAVLCGDYLFAKAFELLSGKGISDCMGCMVEAIQKMCHGEILQASERYASSIDLDTYYNRIAKKTAIFLACCCKAGAILAGADETQTELAGQYGINLGYAFQIIDDILDFCGDVATMGKPAGEDLMQGNLTLPAILLLNTEGYGGWLRHMIDSRDFTPENIDGIRLAMEETGIIRKSYEIAENHAQRAKKALAQLPKSESNILLYNLADMLQIRAN